jgi:hypothetical protein
MYKERCVGKAKKDISNTIVTPNKSPTYFMEREGAKKLGI